MTNLHDRLTALLTANPDVAERLETARGFPAGTYKRTPEALYSLADYFLCEQPTDYFSSALAPVADVLTKPGAGVIKRTDVVPWHPQETRVYVRFVGENRNYEIPGLSEGWGADERSANQALWVALLERGCDGHPELLDALVGKGDDDD